MLSVRYEITLEHGVFYMYFERVFVGFGTLITNILLFRRQDRLASIFFLGGRTRTEGLKYEEKEWRKNCCALRTNTRTTVYVRVKVRSDRYRQVSIGRIRPYSRNAQNSVDSLPSATRTRIMDKYGALIHKFLSILRMDVSMAIVFNFAVLI